MVPEGSHVRSVYLDPSTGILTTPLSSKLLIDCSTIDTATSLSVRSHIAATSPSAGFYDAPVSGGVLGAESATMTFMLGCARSDARFQELHDLLGLMGGNVFPCGGPGLGLTAKLCNNYCSGLIAIATSEAMDIGIKAGMDPRVLAEVFHTSLAQSCISDRWNPVPGICPEAPASRLQAWIQGWVDEEGFCVGGGYGGEGWGEVGAGGKGVGGLYGGDAG